ncbi:HAAO [Cervus elaphus hippelaphus]|uniref:HAAO n=1 Tax=Cervus elaphus hippelaphus TaxID=46360 RepID=A0A212CWM5_CEREH|nr:HAAO [Cervus elaphus hippelaphus]
MWRAARWAVPSARRPIGVRAEARPFDRAEDTAQECGSRETMERPVKVKAWVEENRGSFLPPVCNKLL